LSIPASGHGMAETVADGVLEAWAATRTFGLNIQALKTEPEKVQATLEIAATKELPGLATEKMLQKLWDSAHNAEDLLDELDYFRIHDELHGTYDAADQHGDNVLHDLACDARHTIKALGKLVNCFPKVDQFTLRRLNPKVNLSLEYYSVLVTCWACVGRAGIA
jgi:hypothetical protein